MPGRGCGFSLKHVGFIDLPAHQKTGGFDHAAAHDKSGTLYLAHTANDSLDIIDTAHDKYLRSIPGLPAIAGALVSNEKDLVFTSNRGEKTVGLFRHSQENNVEKVRVGGFPNGLAFDPSRGHLIVANVSRQDDSTPITVSMVDTEKKLLTSDVVVPGRTRWTVFDEKSKRFYVNISKPPQIVAVDSIDPDGIALSFEIPASGPHGLDIDRDRRRLFCACDQAVLYTLDLDSGRVSKSGDLTGPPDVIFYNSRLNHLYVAIGDPGVIDVYDTEKMRRVQTVKTERGAHTIGYSREQDKVYSFLPETHRAAIYLDK